MTKVFYGPPWNCSHHGDGPTGGRRDCSFEVCRIYFEGRGLFGGGELYTYKICHLRGKGKGVEG